MTVHIQKTVLTLSNNKDDVNCNITRHLQQLRVFPADLLQQGRKQCSILLDQLPHHVELRLISEETQGVAWAHKAGMRNKMTHDFKTFGQLGEL